MYCTTRCATNGLSAYHLGLTCQVVSTFSTSVIKTLLISSIRKAALAKIPEAIVDVDSADLLAYIISDV